jgi:hypothetical protein
MQLRRYCVTVMDDFAYLPPAVRTRTRYFWTRDGAEKYWFRQHGDAHLFEWQGDHWEGVVSYG